MTAHLIHRSLHASPVIDCTMTLSVHSGIGQEFQHPAATRPGTMSLTGPRSSLPQCETACEPVTALRTLQQPDNNHRESHTQGTQYRCKNRQQTLMNCCCAAGLSVFLSGLHSDEEINDTLQDTSLLHALQLKGKAPVRFTNGCQVGVPATSTKP
jgi:hypothetical protein